MKIKTIYKILFVVMLLMGAFMVSGCSSDQPQENNTKTPAHETDLYTCGMHPNVIQEGPGNCPICGMNLTPLNGAPDREPATANRATDATGEKNILYYRAPMDPTYISPKPGKSPMGMDLIPVYEGEETYGSTVKINPVTEQNIGVRTATVVERDLYQEIRTIGRVDYDETKVSHVHTKFTGWIEKTFVNTTGQRVNKGDVLVEVYSPDLVSAQEEYLDSYLKLMQAQRENKTAAISNLTSLLASTRKRLEYFDIPTDQIELLEQTQEVRKTLAIRSPFMGIVERKHALDGMEVKPGMALYTISDLSKVWVYADLFEYELPWIKTGQSAKMTLSYAPGKKFDGKVQYIYPYLDEKTRTIKVRLAFDNPNSDLKPGMYTNVVIQSAPVINAIAVPSEAVMFSGERNLVFVALGKGRFAPRDVTIGVESGDNYYQIIEGIDAGEEVVTSAQFLLDSESKLQESVAKMLSVRKGYQAGDTEKSDLKSMEKIEPGKAEETKMNTMNKEHDHSDHKEATVLQDSGMKSLGSRQDQHDHSAHADLNMESISFAKVENDSLVYYTCPMESHNYVRISKAGICPDCGMTLIEKREAYNPDKTYYTCPMTTHSYVISEEPGNCPVCGMTLKEK